MILKNLSLANFRGIEQMSLTFEPNVNVIAGINGIGKSGILRALAVLLARSLPEFTPCEEKPLSFVDEDVKQGKFLLESSLIFEVDKEKCHITGTRRILESERQEKESSELQAIKVAMQSPSLNNHQHRELVEAMARIKASLREEGDRWQLLVNDVSGQTVKAGPRRLTTTEDSGELKRLKDRKNHPIALFIPTGRYLPERPRVLPVPEPFEVKNAYVKALDDQPRTITHFMHWFNTQEKLGGRGMKKRKHILDALRSVVTDFDESYTNLRIQHDPLKMMVDKAGTPLSINQLSDGERGLLAIYFEITRRLAVANPDADDPLKEGQGVVLIDEIELHLHPRWQRLILDRLTTAFPNIQFIVTSHSSLVLGEVDGKCVRFLHFANEKITSWTPRYSRGWDSNRILEDHMESSARSPEMVAELHTLFVAIDEEKLTKANNLIKELEKTLGDEDPELTRAKALISFLEGQP